VGQKTHPKGFRLVTNQKHLATWYSSKVNYKKLAQEDYFIRKLTIENLEKLLTLSSVEISRKFIETENKESVLINITALYPREKDSLKKLINYFNDINLPNPLINLKKNTELNELIKYYTGKVLKEKSINLLANFTKKTKKIYSIKFNFIKNQFEDAMLIAKFISRQLENRIPFRRIVKQAIKKAKLVFIKGIKIELSGRLNGIEIARSEWKRQGNIPLHTLKSSIDYIHHEAKTIYGVIGIKVWLFKN
jgi:small subunit ribosomal protein S3